MDAVSLTVTLDGKDVTGDLLLNSTTGPAEAGTLSFDVAPGEDETHYIVFSSSGISTVRIPSTAKRHYWISEADSRIITDFLIASFARGFARNGIDT